MYFLCIGRIESDPQKNKPAIDIFGHLRPMQPTQCAMDTQGQGCGMKGSLAGGAEVFMVTIEGDSE
jgi:hypothetical protein